MLGLTTPKNPVTESTAWLVLNLVPQEVHHWEFSSFWVLLLLVF